MWLDYRRDAGRFSHGADVCDKGGPMKLTTIWRAMWQACQEAEDALHKKEYDLFMKRNRQDIKFSAYLYKRLKELDDESQR
jgi:hypothetical protein